MIYITLTPEQFSILATKDDVKKEVTESEERIKKEIHKVLNAVDGLAKKTENIEAEQTSNLATHNRFEERITKVEEHICKLSKEDYFYWHNI